MTYNRRLRTITAFCIFMISIAVNASAYPYHFQEINKSFDDIARKLNQLDFDNKRETVDPADIAKLQQLAGNNKQLQARAIYWKVRMNQLNARPADCIELLLKAEKLCDDKYLYDKALIYYQLSGNYDRIGDYQKCYHYGTRAIERLEKTDDYYFLGNIHLLMAQLYQEINYNDNSSQHLNLAEKNYKLAGYPLNRIYFYKSILASNNKEKIMLLRKSIELGENDWMMSVQAYINQSNLYLKHNMLDSAYYYYNGGLNLMKQHDSNNVFFSSMLSLSKAKILFQEKKYNEAIDVLNSLIAVASVLKGEYMMSDFYRYYWLCYDRLGQKDKAYKMLMAYQKEYERTTRYVRNQDVPKAKAREEILRQSDKIRLLEKDAQLKSNYLYMALLAIVVILVAVVALGIYLYLRYRIREIANERLRENLQHEALVYSMNRKNFEEDMKQKDCELSSNTLLLANKNEVLRQLSDITRKFSDEGKVPREYVKQVNDIIGNSLKNDDEWYRFKLHFDSVHPDFFVKLKEMGPDLTENDLRLCAYINIGMRAKQIAEMLNVSPDSVNSNRYRLRKKLGLERNQSLDNFIRNI